MRYPEVLTPQRPERLIRRGTLFDHLTQRMIQIRCLPAYRFTANREKLIVGGTCPAWSLTVKTHGDQEIRTL